MPAGAEAVVVDTAAETILLVEQELGSTAQERQYSGGAVDHETVASNCDQGLAQGDKQKLTATCGCLRCKGGSGVIGWRGVRSIGGSTYSSSSSSVGGGPMLDGFRSG